MNVEKEVMLERMNAIKTGERVRVLFDLLMETIKAEQSITKGAVFEAIKEAMEKEQQALMDMSPAMQRAFGEVKKSRKKKGFDGAATPTNEGI